MSATMLHPDTGQTIRATDVLTDADRTPVTAAPTVAHYPCDRFLSLRPCAGGAAFGVCGQCQKARLS